MKNIAIVVTMLAVAVLFAAALAQPAHSKWVSIDDAYRIHERYVTQYPDGSASMIGEFYEVEPGDLRVQCAGGQVHNVLSPEQARKYIILACAIR